MEIKRNIFDSSARMPKQYENIAVPMVQEDADCPQVGYVPQTNASVVHARSPRIGEK